MFQILEKLERIEQAQDIVLIPLFRSMFQIYLFMNGIEYTIVES